MVLIPELAEQGREIRVLERDVRSLKTTLARIGAGGRVRASVIIGTVPASSSQPSGSVTVWTNASAGTRSAGDVAIYLGNRTFSTTTTQGDPKVIGVVMNETAVIVGGEADIRHNGYCPLVNVVGAVTAGHFLECSTTATRASDAGAARTAGSFAIALSAFAGPGNGTVAAFLLGASTDHDIVLGHSASGLAAGQLLHATGATTFAFADDEHGSEITMGDGINTIAAGELTWFEVPYDLTVVGWTLAADATGDLVIDIWKDVYANFPPTVADTVAGSEKPTLATQRTNQDLALSTWTVDWTKGDWILINIDSASGVKKATLALRWKKR